MFKLTVEVDNRVITKSLPTDECVQYVSHVQSVLEQEQGWITLYDTNHGIVIVSSDHLRRAFIKFEEVPCE